MTTPTSREGFEILTLSKKPWQKNLREIAIPRPPFVYSMNDPSSSTPLRLAFLRFPFFYCYTATSPPPPPEVFLCFFSSFSGRVGGGKRQGCFQLAWHRSSSLESVSITAVAIAPMPPTPSPPPITIAVGTSTSSPSSSRSSALGLESFQNAGRVGRPSL